jgi:uncharacterized protein (TIGR02300 family)
MKDFDRGSKRKCTSCSTLFFDFNNSPIICPACGAQLTSLLTNVSKRGRPPKSVKLEKEEKPTDDIKIEEIPNEESELADIEPDDSPVEEIIEIKKEEE